jgi:D-glycero-D-manno-heptose 1,7-bisphosphate phosphatase
LFVDIDGTLTETISGATFKKHPHDVKIIQGADKALKHFADNGAHCVGISNQAGIKSGYKTLASASQEMLYTLSLFPELQEIYFCPDFAGEECWHVTRSEFHEIGTREPQLIGLYRKPHSGMLELAKLFIEDGEREVTGRLMVGDRPEDKDCANEIGIDFLWAEEWRRKYGLEID